jgi:FecR protein
VKPDCEIYRQELVALKMGEAADMDKDLLAQHLQSCDECSLAETTVSVLFELIDENQPALPAGGSELLRKAVTTQAPTALLHGMSLRNRLVAAAAIVMMTAAAFWTFKASPGDKPQAVNVAVLSAIRGQLPPANNQSQLVAGDVLRAGTRICLAPNGRVRIVMHRGAMIELSGGSVLKILSSDLILLEQGKVLAAVRKGATSFRVRTKLAEVRTLGTQFIVETDSDRTRVAVREGRVEFSSLAAGNGKVEVGQGQISSVAGAGPSLSPSVAKAGDLLWDVLPPRVFQMSLTLGQKQIDPGQVLTARLTLVNTSGRGLDVDGSGRGRSSYFIRVLDPHGRESHFVPAVTGLVLGGQRLEDPVVHLKSGESCQLELNLSGFAVLPGVYTITAVYLENAVPQTVGWHGVTESDQQKFIVRGLQKKEKKGTTTLIEKQSGRALPSRVGKNAKEDGR